MQIFLGVFAQLIKDNQRLSVRKILWHRMHKRLVPSHMAYYSNFSTVDITTFVTDSEVDVCRSSITLEAKYLQNFISFV